MQNGSQLVLHSSNTEVCVHCCHLCLWLEHCLVYNTAQCAEWNIEVFLQLPIPSSRVLAVLVDNSSTSRQFPVCCLISHLLTCLLKSCQLPISKLVHVYLYLTCLNQSEAAFCGHFLLQCIMICQCWVLNCYAQRGTECNTGNFLDKHRTCHKL